MHVNLKDYNLSDFTYLPEKQVYTIESRDEADIAKLFIEDLLGMDFAYSFYNYYCDSIDFWFLLKYEAGYGTISDLPLCIQKLIHELENQGAVFHMENITDEEGSFQYFIKEEFSLDRNKILSQFKNDIIEYSIALHNNRLNDYWNDDEDYRMNNIMSETSAFSDLLSRLSEEDN